MEDKNLKFKQYVWDKMIAPQLGYSFNLAHGVSYSLIAVQEMNLATRWDPLFWECACLCVNAGNSETDFSDDEDDIEQGDDSQEVEEIEEETEEKVKRVAPNYGKIAKAISDVQHRGVIIELPDINKADSDFIPDINNNAILYSLQAINVVNPDLMDKIIKNRPYSSMFDFLSKVDITQSQMRGLIKAGCFDGIEKLSRQAIMAKYLQYLADQEISVKDKLTMTQLRQALDLGMSLAGYENQIRLFKYKKYIDKNQYNPTTKRYELTEEECIRFFTKFVEPYLLINKDEYSYIGDNVIAMKKAPFTKFYEKEMSILMQYLNSDAGKQEFFKLQQTKFINDIKEQYCTGSVASWEMETMCFYHEPHELKGINEILYGIKNFNDLPEVPVQTTAQGRDGKTYTKTETCAIAGTVINADNQRHIVSVLTLNGVVNVKFYSGMYVQYNQKISVVDSNTKKKTVIDDSWFKRGTKIMVYGYRRENIFNAKNSKVDGFNRCVCLIKDLHSDGSASFQYTRKKHL